MFKVTLCCYYAVLLCCYKRTHSCKQASDAYIDALVEARKKKGMQRDVAIDTINGDVNMFGVIM